MKKPQILTFIFLFCSSPPRLFWQLKFRIWSQKESNALGGTTTQIATTAIVSTPNATFLGTPLSASTVLLQTGFEDIELPANHPSRIIGFLATAATATTAAAANASCRCSLHVPNGGLHWSSQCGGIHQILATGTPTALLPHASYTHDDGGRQGCPTPVLPRLCSVRTYGQMSASEQREYLGNHEVSLNGFLLLQLYFIVNILFSPFLFLFHPPHQIKNFFTLFVTPSGMTEWYDTLPNLRWWIYGLISSLFQVWKILKNIKIRIFGIAWGILVRSFSPSQIKIFFFLKNAFFSVNFHPGPEEKNTSVIPLWGTKKILGDVQCVLTFFIYSTNDHQKIRTPHLHDNLFFNI